MVGAISDPTNKRRPNKLGRFHTPTVLRFTLAILFIAAGTMKATEQPAFFTELMKYELVEANLAYNLSWLILGMEVLLGFWLLSGTGVRYAALFGLGLMLSFTAALASAWVRELDVSCACFGPVEIGGGYLGWFLRNVVFMAAFAWLAWRSPPRPLTILKPR